MLAAIERLVTKAFRMAGIQMTRIPSPGGGGVYSSLDEQNIIGKYLKMLEPQNRYCVDIAASDGIRMSNTYALYQAGWGGLAVEYNAGRFSSLAAGYLELPGVNLARCMVTPENVVSLLAANQAPEQFDFLNLDIDGYDYFVLEKILEKYRPRLICTEINEKIPPPIKFTVKWDPGFAWVMDHFYGQSISQLHMLAAKFDYALVELHYNNAFLIPVEYSPWTSLSAEEAYRIGYVEKPDRRKKFPWNEDMEGLLHMPPEEGLSFIKGCFERYDGRYDASL